MKILFPLQDSLPLLLFPPLILIHPQILKVTFPPFHLQQKALLYNLVLTTLIESLPVNPSNSPQNDQPTEVPAKPTRRSMQTRTKSRICKPKVFSTTKEQSVHEDLQQKQWKQLKVMNIWPCWEWYLVLGSSPANRNPIGCKWVFKVKNNLDGTVHKYKARFVAKRFD